MSQKTTSWTICQRLLDAESENTVGDILGKINSDRIEWLPRGQRNNYGIVENQQSEPMAALTELFTNSLDALLLKRYRKKYGNDGTGEEFQSLHGAAQDLLNTEKDTIQLRAEGAKRGPLCLEIYDNGCGQPPSKFEETFLGFLEPGRVKRDYSFLQGKYGMGSAGVLSFCGDGGYKFIASAAVDNPNEWSWTLIHKNESKAQYEYLTLDGDIPRYEGEIGDQSYGTFVRLFNYQSRHKRSLDGLFRKRLERYLVRSPIPIELQDERYDEHAVTKGLLPRLDTHSEYIQGQETPRFDFGDDLIGQRTVSIITLKDDEKLEEEGLSPDLKREFVRGEEHKDQAVFFTVNGQTHGDQGQTFIKNRCGYSQVSKDTLVFVRFDDLDGSEMVNLFKPSRDRLQSGDAATALKQGLEDVLEDSDLLLDEEQSRRSSITQEEQDKGTEDLLRNIISQNRDLLEYLNSGTKIPAHTSIDSDTDAKNFEGSMYPSRLAPIETFRSRFDYDLWKKEELYKVSVPVNRRTVVHFELNAENNFFTRDTDSGKFAVSEPDLVQSFQLNQGILSITIVPDQKFDPGTSEDLRIEVTPSDSDGKLSVSIRVAFTEAEDELRSSVSSRTGTQGADLPNPEPVYRDDWDTFNFTEHDIVEVAPGPDQTDVYVNMESAPLLNFLARHDFTDQGRKYVENIYKVSATLYSVVLYRELTDQLGTDSEHDISELVRSGMQGIGIVILEQTLSNIELEELTH